MAACSEAVPEIMVEAVEDTRSKLLALAQGCGMSLAEAARLVIRVPAAWEL